MGMNKGTLMLLKMGDGASPTEQFTTLGGMRTVSMKVQRQILTSSDVASGAWREVAAEAGLAHVRLQGSGLVMNDAVEERLRTCALNGTAQQFKLFFANGDVLSGPFMAAHYERGGALRDAETFSVILESAGEVTLSEA